MEAMLALTFSVMAFLLSWAACIIAARFAPGMSDLREIRRRLNVLEQENTQLRIHLAEHDLYPAAVSALESAEKEELSIHIGSKQVFGLVKEHPRRK